MSPCPAEATANGSTMYQAVPASQPPLLDGGLTDPVWKNADIATDFYDITTQRPAAPDVATSAYVLYDATALYVAFECTQRSSAITARQTTNGIGEETDDQVEVNIDTSGNGSRVYSFKATPGGVRYQRSSESKRYNPPWRAASRAGQGSWSAVMMIPLSDLRSGPAAWRINFQRRVAATDEAFSWVYDPRMVGPDDARYWPQLGGMRLAGGALRPLPHADLFGLASVGADRGRFQQSSGAFADQKARPYGGDLTYPLTSTLAFVGTANPDFSNVEVDQQTIAPQQFQRVLAEYRPFFSQGSDYLIPGSHYNVAETKDAIFYSPSIGTFDSGEKIEGTIRSDAMGVLAVDGPGFADQAFGLAHVTPSQDFRYFIDGVAARHTQDGSSVTACPSPLTTCRDDTFEGGVHVQSPTSGLATSVWYAAESGDYVPIPALGHALTAVVFRERRNASLYAGYYDIGPYFAPVDGFTAISDVRGPAFYAEFIGAGSSRALFKDWDGYVGGNRDLDRSGHVSYAQLYANLTVDLRGRTTLDIGQATSEQRTSSGYPSYLNSQLLPYDQAHVKLTYAKGTSSPVSVGYAWGPFAANCSPSAPIPIPTFALCATNPNLYAPYYLQQVTSSAARQLGMRYNVSAEFDGTDERAFLGPSDTQWLRRVSFGESLSPNATVSIGVRSITGTGGSAQPGLNLAASFHDQFPTGDELFVAFGSPASPITLDRVIVKFVLHLGRGGVGT